MSAIGGLSRQNGGKTAVFLIMALIMLEFWFLDTVTPHTVLINQKKYLPSIGDISHQNGVKITVFLTLAWMILEFWFLDR